MLAKSAYMLRKKLANSAFVLVSFSALSCLHLSKCLSLFYHVSGHGAFLKNDITFFFGQVRLCANDPLRLLASLAAAGMETSIEDVMAVVL